MTLLQTKITNATGKTENTGKGVIREIIILQSVQHNYHNFGHLSISSRSLLGPTTQESMAHLLHLEKPVSSDV